MAQNTLKVKQRYRLGKGGARQVRREGDIPSILYGRETEPIPLVVNPNDLKQALSTEAGENTLLEIKIQGDGEEFSKLALLRDIQFDYLTSKPIHLDFQEVLMKEKLHVRVPVKFVGLATGVRNEHGILEEILREIEIECFPKDIPNFFEVDVSELGLGDSIHIGDLKISEDLTVLHEHDDTVVTVLAPKVEEEAVVEAVGVEVAEGAEKAELEEKGVEESEEKE
ncbi:MAG: 50S ribosomal protein L25 [Deltaproteobacteria bacterium]|nr:50S ribosomal protein L25 [Deltaproteobacteria bacterium]